MEILLSNNLCCLMVAGLLLFQLGNIILRYEHAIINVLMIMNMMKTRIPVSRGSLRVRSLLLGKPPHPMN